MDLNELMFNLDDIRVYVNVAKNINSDNRILAHIQETQRFDLAEWIGNPFYLDIWQNPVSYNSLINGTTYTYEGKTYQYFGLMPFLCIMAAVRIVRDNSFSVTATGNVIKDTEQSTPATDAAKMNFLRELSNRAMPYKDQAMQYLCRNRAQYPLYCGCADNKAVEDKTLQLFTGVGRYGNQKL